MPENLLLGLGEAPKLVLAAEDFLAVYESQDQIERLTPDFSKLQGLPFRGVIATAPGRKTDFVSRCFYPNVGVNEDPVTGSAHCTLVPYWAGYFKKSELEAFQLSKRGGHLKCKLYGERVFLYGNALKYLEGEIEI